MSDGWGGVWTDVKLDVLRKYLQAFTTPSKRARRTVYLDLFAGTCAGSDSEGSPYGSAELAMTGCGH